ncbi:MAG: dihydroorotate dehydrogenase (quinone) [Rhodobacteraceae bacterium]|nr:dihydroorotate dehydrogenase (quinone) [Paracoccaceae bacterium]
MKALETLGLAALRRLDPERAHGLALKALSSGLVTPDAPVQSPRLKVNIAGLALPNPVGLAAGFDKNAEVIDPLTRSGFGFVELGGVTPRPQPGNPRPRLFRLAEDRAVINRFGLNSDGAKAVAARLAARAPGGIVGLNLGANKDSADRAADYSTLIDICGPYLDFATVNVSSPNTEKLRDLQGKDALTALLRGVMDTRATLDRPLPIFLKIAPDLTHPELDDIAAAARDTGVDAIIATNTTISRDGLVSPNRVETGGLSGAPLFEPSTRVLAYLSQATGGDIPLVGVGGIASAEDAYTKIRAGASALQLYSALVYQGLGLVTRINRGLDALLARDGHDSIADAVGTGREEWL